MSTIEVTSKALNPEQFKELLLMNRFKFTLVSRKTATRFTYKISSWNTNNYRDKKSYTVAVLTGTDNDNHFQTIAYIHKEKDSMPQLHHAYRRISKDAPSYKAFVWLFVNMLHTQKLSDSVIIYNSGKCAKCGRTLTDPLSIERGLGPECYSHKPTFNKL